MRRLASFLIALIMLGVTGLIALEVLWRAIHVAVDDESPGPGWFVAEVRVLREGSDWPYGSGVFLFPRLFPVRSLAARRVFAGYCGHVDLKWPQPDVLQITCLRAEGATSIDVEAHAGIRIEAIVLPQNDAAYGAGSSGTDFSMAER